MNTSFRTLVMCRAHELFKTGLSWSDSLKKSWQLYRLYKKMLTKKVTFYFEKVDGSIRKAIGTLQVDYSPKGNRKPNNKLFTYFDIEKGEFRCFRVDNFISEKAPVPTKPIYRRNILKRQRFLLTA